MESNRRKHPQIILLGDRTRIDEAGLLEGFMQFAATTKTASCSPNLPPKELEMNHHSALGQNATEPERTSSHQCRKTSSATWCHSSVAKEIFSSIRRYTEVVAVHFSPTHIPDAVLRQPLDFAICFGGDGAILRAAKQLQPLQIPALAVNLGHLGFLADVAPDALSETLQILDTEGIDSRVQAHLMLHCRVRKVQTTDHSEVLTDATSLTDSENSTNSVSFLDSEGDRSLNSSDVRTVSTFGGDEAVALNEISVQTGDSFRLIDLELAIDGETVSYYSGDGLILATPVGSTAHSLSAGGPILRHGLETILICPLNPHTLTMRPVVDSADRTYTITVVHGEPGMSLIVDGTVLTRLQTGDRIEITRAPAVFRTITPPRHSYYRTLREKLGWSGRFDAKKKG
ncbi:MAG: NAD(+)/NADH kinase [Thermoguttaceae bacterium]|nr:NAD(+)/NADH kinase [Thermoguttaceae bacterium]